MALRTRITPIDRSIRLVIDRTASPEAQSQLFAKFARQKLAEGEAANARVLGSVPPHETTVDGRKGASEDTVRPDGVIHYEFELVDDVILFISEQLVQHSPFLTGRYAHSHSLFADGVEVDIAALPPLAKQYTFVAGTAYARKIERGQSNQAPDGVYEAVAALASKRFGNVVQIRFGYRQVGEVSADLVGGARRAAKKALQQPSITVTLR